MPTPRHVVAALAAASLATGCATIQAADRRASVLSTYFQQNPFPRTCDAIWPDVLKVAAARGFPLSSKDRQRLGEEPEGVMTQVISAAAQTYRTQDGGLVAETDWRRESGTRLRMTGNPAGADGCRVRYDVIAGGVTTADEQPIGPDWNLDADLLHAVDPARAAALEATVGG
jgi:hypothetical protein